MYNVAWAEACLYTKWHPNPSNCLATIHERHRETDSLRQDRQRSNSIGRTVSQTVAQKLIALAAILWKKTSPYLRNGYIYFNQIWYLDK